MAVSAPYGETAASIFKLDRYDTSSTARLRSSLSFAGQWSLMMMNRYRELFTDSLYSDARAMMNEAYAKASSSMRTLSDYDESKSWFLVRIEPKDPGKKKFKKIGGWGSSGSWCSSWRWCTGDHLPSSFDNYAGDHLVRWRLSDPDPKWSEMEIPPNTLNGITLKCCKSLTPAKVYIAPVSPDDFGFPDAPGVETRGYLAQSWNNPIYRSKYAPGVSTGTVDKNHKAFRERAETRALSRRLMEEAAATMRCVELGVAWTISYGLNKAKAGPTSRI